MENLIILLDRAHPVVLRTEVKRLEKIIGRISDGVTSEISDSRQFLAFLGTIV